MGDGHLIADGAYFVMSSLFGFAVAETREVTFNFGAEVVSLFKEFSVARDFGTGIVSDIAILCAAISVAF